jgi:hypothetical protein
MLQSCRKPPRCFQKEWYLIEAMLQHCRLNLPRGSDKPVTAKFAFVTFDQRDAQGALRVIDRLSFYIRGRRLRVELVGASQDNNPNEGGRGEGHGHAGFNRGRRELPPSSPPSFQGYRTRYRCRSLPPGGT